MKPKSFRLSDEAAAALEQLAARHKCSQTKVLEFLILDRHSVSDQRKNAARREWEIMTRHESWRGVPQETIYRIGYRDGWQHFQIRHSDNDFVVDLPVD